MIIRMGLEERETTTVPRIIRMMLTRAIRRSLEIALVSERVKVAMKGRTNVNSTMFTPARSERRSPACN